MKARDVMNQNDGDVTKAYYRELSAFGIQGQLAVALFRAQKRSSAAKSYRRRAHRGEAYDVKNWSMGEVCRILREGAAELGIEWGWQQDPDVRFNDGASWVLYVDLPNGQVSFHSPTRISSEDYPGPGWDGIEGASVERIVAYCDFVSGEAPLPTIQIKLIEPSEADREHLKTRERLTQQFLLGATFGEE